MSKWQPINTLTYINSILNPKGYNLEKEEYTNRFEVTYNYKVTDFQNKSVIRFMYLKDVISEYKDILYPSYEYDDMEEI